MKNMFMIIGRIVELPEEIEIVDTGIKQMELKIKILENINESTEVVVRLPKQLVNNIKEYATVNDLIGVKGFIGNKNVLFAEKVTFLAGSCKKD